MRPAFLQTPSREEWVKLIRKLRWIGMEEEASRLQTDPPQLANAFYPFLRLGV